MKKTLLSVLALAGSLSAMAAVTAVTPTAGTANPFAYGLASEDYDATETSTFKVQYSLNADATDVKLQVLNGETVVAETACEGKTKGSHVAEIDLTDLENGEYTWQIAVTGGAKTTIEEFANPMFYHPRGVDVDNNMESPSFGNIYVTEGMKITESKYWSGTRGGVGLYIFDPQMNGVMNEKTGMYAFMSDLTYTYFSYAADLARVRVAEDGRIFVTRCNNAGDYILYAPSHEDLVKNNKFHSLLAGGSLDQDSYQYNTTEGFLAGPNVGFDVKGIGDDLKIVASSCIKTHFTTVGESKGSRVDEYELGTAKVLPTPDIVNNLSDYTVMCQSSNVEYDDRGGIWYCQYRGTPKDNNPALVYVDANGNQKYFEGLGGKVRGGGGIRFSPDFTQIAIPTTKTTFSIYDITYADDNTPTLTEKTSITHGIGTNVNDIAWDLAGNIYICGNSKEYLKGFALPRANNTFATKAASKYGFTKKGGVITEVETIKAENAPVEYYNLQGVKVENPSNGIFIKKQGAKATKVVL